MMVKTQFADLPSPFKLESNRQIPELRLAYEIYGELNAQKNNAILVCHGLTSTQHAAGKYTTSDSKPGWWDAVIGPGKPIDTNRFCVICPNVLGGFGGSTSPAHLEPDTQQAYAMRFPVVTIADIVSAQLLLADFLQIKSFHAVIGGCMGGFQVLEWLKQSPQRVCSAIVISAGARVSTHTVAMWKVLSDAIRIDPAWRGGNYYESGVPEPGLALASRIGSLFWMSRDVMDKRFNLKTVAGRPLSYSFDTDFEIESFLDKIGHGASHKIDPNSLLYLMRAMSYFDIARGFDGPAAAFKNVKSRILLVSYESDWRYPPQESECLREAFARIGAPVEHRIFDSKFGHGAFIYDVESLAPAIADFISIA